MASWPTKKARRSARAHGRMGCGALCQDGGARHGLGPADSKRAGGSASDQRLGDIQLLQCCGSVWKCIPQNNRFLNGRMTINHWNFAIFTGKKLDVGRCDQNMNTRYVNKHHT